MASQNSEFLAVRVTPHIVGEIRSIAQSEDENKSTILRRIIRRGLEQERTRREANSDGAA